MLKRFWVVVWNYRLYLALPPGDGKTPLWGRWTDNLAGAYPFRTDDEAMKAACSLRLADDVLGDIYIREKEADR